MNAAWAGQWDMKEIMISMGNHVTTDNLKLGGEFTVAFATKKTMVASDFVGIVSAKNDPKKMEKTGWNIEKATMVNAPVFTDFPMTLECRIKEKYDESETGYYLVAEIVNILVDEKYLAEDGTPEPSVPETGRCPRSRNSGDADSSPPSYTDTPSRSKAHRGRRCA